jgi:hypothetical protein
MFNFSGKKNSDVKVKDEIWITAEAKWNGMIAEHQEDPDTVFVFWFDESLRQAESYFSRKTAESFPLTTARELHSHLVKDKQVIFAEHYPLKKREQELFQNLHLTEALVYSALDEPMFRRFGADKISGMIKHLGMNESESLQHPMITKAIENAQQQLEDKIITEQLALSQHDWFEKNFPA